MVHLPTVFVKYKIPELAYAVVVSRQHFGNSNPRSSTVNSNFKANSNDKFRIGSITKTITKLYFSRFGKTRKNKMGHEIFDLYRN